MLSEEQTSQYIRLAKAGDASAKEALLEGNVSLLKSIVRRYLGKGVEFDDLFQLACGFDWRFFTLAHDCAHNFCGVLLFAILPKDFFQIFRRIFVDNLKGGQLLLGVHPHIKRPIVQKRKPPFCGVELIAADAKIRQHSINFKDPKLCELAFYVTKICVHKADV